MYKMKEKKKREYLVKRSTSKQVIDTLIQIEKHQQTESEKKKVKPYMQRIPKYGAIKKEPVVEPEATVPVAPVKRKRQNWDIMHALGDNYMPDEKKPEEPSTDLSME